MNKLSETILSILGDCWEKFICSSLPARLMEEFPARKLTYWEVSQQTKVQTLLASLVVDIGKFQPFSGG